MMIDTKKSKALLKKLMLSREVTFGEVMMEFNFSESEVNNLLCELNEPFENNVIILDQKGIHITEPSKVLSYKYYFNKNEKLFESHGAHDRYNLILVELLMQREYNSLLSLSDICHVSKNTTLTDLKIVKERVRDKGLTVNYSRETGYFISGPEFTIRNLLVATVKKVLHSTAGRILLVEKEFVTESDIYLLRKRLEKVEGRIGIKLTDEQLDDLPYILQLVIDRSYNFQEDWSFKIEKYDIKNTVEYPIIKDMFWDYYQLTETDLLYLSLQVLSSNMVESALKISNGEEISRASDQFIKNIESYLAIRIVMKSELKDKVILHMGPAIYRSLMGLQINNPLAEEFIEEYPEIYNIVKKSVSPFEQIIHHNLSKEEIVYLSMIILSWIYQTEEADSVFKAVVLCQSGTSISKLLLVTLRSMFPEIDFVGAYSVRQFKETEEEVDFIFTTLPFESNVTTFLISPILDKQQRMELKSRVKMEMHDNNQRMSRKLLHSIRNYISEQDHEIVEEKIEEVLQNSDIDPKTDTSDEHEHFVFSIDNISIINKSIKWQDLVDLSMKPLIKRGSVTTAYVEQTKCLFYEDYNSMLIAPEVYLPHASPEFGAKKVDFQVLIFRNPVVSPDGSKLKIVVALSPDKNNKHVPTLIKLNNLLLNQEVRYKIIHEYSMFATKQLLNE